VRHPLSTAILVCHSLVPIASRLSPPVFRRHHEGVDAQAGGSVRESSSLIITSRIFESRCSFASSVRMFFFPDHASDARDPAGKSLIAEGVRGDVRRHAGADLADIRFVDIGAHKSCETSPTVTTGVSMNVDMSSPACRVTRSTVPSIGLRMMVLSSSAWASARAARARSTCASPIGEVLIAGAVVDEREFLPRGLQPLPCHGIFPLCAVEHFLRRKSLRDQGAAPLQLDRRIFQDGLGLLHRRLRLAPLLQAGAVVEAQQLGFAHA